MTAQPRRWVAAARRHELAFGVALALLVAAASMIVTLQGFRSRVTAFDLLTYIYSADAFLAGGGLPEHGDTGSYGSFKPPGTAWLMLPSRLLTSDPRLAEYAGTAILHAITLSGIFLVGRRYFDARVGALAVVLYGLSAHGLFLAGSLWPNGRPDFYVLIVLLAGLWVARRDARLLAAGLLVWAVAMYVDMAHAPALFIFLVLWAVARPPVRAAPLVVAAIVAVAVWAPYLRLELDRDFTDIRSQLLLQDVLPADYRVAWCEPGRPLLEVPVVEGSTGGPGASSIGAPDAAVTSPEPAAPASLGLAGALVEKTLSNFTEATLVPFGGVVICGLVAAAVLLYATEGRPAPSKAPGTIRAVAGAPPQWALAAGASLLLLAVVLYALPAVIPDGPVGLPTLRRAALAAALVGGVTLALPWTVGVLEGALSRRGVAVQGPGAAAERRTLLLALLVPWVVLVAVAEAGKPERFWWIWPAQVVLLSAALVDLVPRHLGRRVAILVGGLVVVVLAANTMLASRIEGWRDTGWSGADAPEVQVVDFLAADLVDGQDRASIGYRTYIYPFMATYHVTNPVYKVGAEFDMLLRYRHGVRNANQCAEGLSPADEIRVLQTRRKPEPWQPRHYFDEPLEPGFRLVRDFGLYQVWTRAG